jgi:excisionase family DNA binding protein
MARTVERLYYGVFEVAILLGIPEGSVRRLIAERAIPARRFSGRRVLIPRDELLAVLRDLPPVVPVDADALDELEEGDTGGT